MFCRMEIVKYIISECFSSAQRKLNSISFKKANGNDSKNHKKANDTFEQISAYDDSESGLKMIRQYRIDFSCHLSGQNILRWSIQK